MTIFNLIHFALLDWLARNDKHKKGGRGMPLHPQPATCLIDNRCD
jgi:hypothetical protein